MGGAKLGDVFARRIVRGLTDLEENSPEAVTPGIIKYVNVNTFNLIFLFTWLNAAPLIVAALD